MSCDWRSAAERLTQFAHMDPGLRSELNSLSKALSRDDKLAFKLEGQLVVPRLSLAQGIELLPQARLHVGKLVLSAADRQSTLILLLFPNIFWDQPTFKS